MAGKAGHSVTNYFSRIINPDGGEHRCGRDSNPEFKRLVLNLEHRPTDTEWLQLHSRVVSLFCDESRGLDDDRYRLDLGLLQHRHPGRLAVDC